VENVNSKKIVNYSDLEKEAKNNNFDLLKILKQKYYNDNWKSHAINVNVCKNIIKELLFLTDDKLKELPAYQNYEISVNSKKFNI